MLASATQTTSPRKFEAVIVYVPEEFVWCDWLYRQLDNTPVPPPLAGHRTRHGFTRASTLHIFPDPRDPVQLARYSKSLPPCRHLVVVCSPTSADSPELEQRIKAFKKTESGDRIVVLVVDGDPEHHDTPIDQQWLPAWLSWRLDEQGCFRPAEETEPLIIDARSGRLDLPEARAQLLAALLDLQRDQLRAYDDLVTVEGSATLLPTPDAASSSSGAPRRSGVGIALSVAALALVGVFVGLRWKAGQGSVPAAPTPEPLAAATPSATPVPVAAATTPRPAEPATQPTITPAPPAGSAPMVASVATPALTPATQVTPTPKVVAKAVATPKPATPRPPMAFSPGSGPVTPIKSIPAEVRSAVGKGTNTDWQRLRDLGDTLLEQGKRDAGLIALGEATAGALKVASAPQATSQARLDAARLCFRVGALQKQHLSTREARATLQDGLAILRGVPDRGEAASERDSIRGNIETLLQSLGN